MSFSTEKDKQNSNRWFLLRITAARDITAELHFSGGTWQTTSPYPVARIERNGVELTHDASGP